MSESLAIAETEVAAVIPLKGLVPARPPMSPEGCKVVWGGRLSCGDYVMAVDRAWTELRFGWRLWPRKVPRHETFLVASRTGIVWSGYPTGGRVALDLEDWLERKFKAAVNREKWGSE